MPDVEANRDLLTVGIEGSGKDHLYEDPDALDGHESITVVDVDL